MDETEIKELAREWEAERIRAEQSIRAALEGSGSLDAALTATREAGRLEVNLRCAQVRYAVESVRR